MNDSNNNDIRKHTIWAELNSDVSDEINIHRFIINKELHAR